VTVGQPSVKTNMMILRGVSDLTPNMNFSALGIVPAGGTLLLDTTLGIDFPKYVTFLYIDISNVDPAPSSSDIEVNMLTNYPLLPGSLPNPGIGRVIPAGTTHRQDVRGIDYINRESIGGDRTTTPRFIPNSTWPAYSTGLPNNLKLQNRTGAGVRCHLVWWGIA